jgi:hypothetical protein
MSDLTVQLVFCSYSNQSTENRTLHVHVKDFDITFREIVCSFQVDHRCPQRVSVGATTV